MATICFVLGSDLQLSESESDSDDWSDIALQRKHL